VQRKSSHGGAVGLHIITAPVDTALAGLELDATTDVEDELETFEVEDDAPLLEPEIEDVVPPLAPEPASPVPPPPPFPPPVGPSALGDESLPVAQLAATVTATPKASNKTATFCTYGS